MAICCEKLFLFFLFVPNLAKLLDVKSRDESSKSIQDFNKPWIYSPKTAARNEKPPAHQNGHKNRIEPSEDKSTFTGPNNVQPVAIGMILGISDKQKKPMGIVISFHNGEILQHQFGQITNIKRFPIQNQAEDEKSKEKHVNNEQIKFPAPAIKKAKQKQNQHKLANENDDDDDSTFLSEMDGYNWLD